MSTFPLPYLVAEAIQEDRLTQAAAAAQIGIGEAVLNQWLKGAYKGNNEKIAAECEKWLQSRNSRKSIDIPAVGFVPTPSSEQIRAALVLAHHSPTIGLVYGASGAGKTATATDYMKSNAGVFLVTCTPSTNTTAAILDETCHILGAGKVSGKLNMQREIVKKLKNMGALVVFDEAQHLSHTALEQCRSIFDLSGCGMVFIGNQPLYSKFTGGKRSAEFAQLFGRIAKPLHIRQPTHHDAACIISAWGITDEKSVSLLKGIGQKNGGLRMMVHVIKLSYLYADQSPTLDDLKESWSSVGSGGVSTIGDE
jgi:DNA transposition AAA+ family ATPase